jgi:hypothetical protein
MTKVDPTVLFIGGAGRSGSTLLERLLGQLDGVTAAGEITHLWVRGLQDDQLCGCGQPFSECEFWREVVVALSLKHPLHEPGELVELRNQALRLPLVPNRSKRRQAYLGLLRELYRAIADVSGARVIVDSSKYPREAYLLRELSSLEVKFIHLVRDSNAVVYSWQRRRRRPEVQGDHVLMPRYPWWKTAAAWILYNGAFEWLARLEPDQVLRVRYEDIIEDPRGVLGTICRFVPIPEPDFGFLQNDSALLGLGHTVSGNPMRFTQGPVTLQIDDEWRSDASGWQTRAVSLVTLWPRIRYGYRIRGPGEKG